MTKIIFSRNTIYGILFFLLCLANTHSVFSQDKKNSFEYQTIDIGSFWDSANHWHNIIDEIQYISPVAGQKKFKPNEITKIADNILRYQKDNGGWPKNYDMLAILTEKQKKTLVSTKNILNTTIDNDATHSHIQYLAKAYHQSQDIRYKEAGIKGIEYLLSAQYSNGGWPQFFPDTSGYRKYITFNDGAMVGVMNLFRDIVYKVEWFSFVDKDLFMRVETAFKKGLDCILKCQITQNGVLTAWCQQHDNIDYHPQNARTFEPASICSMESAEIIEFLMSIQNPSDEIIRSVKCSAEWLDNSSIRGIRIEKIKAPIEKFQYHTADFDRVVIEDKSAMPLWARLYELSTNKPIFCNRDSKIVYSLAEVHRERRTGYAWYNYNPDKTLKIYEKWLADQKK